MEGMKGMAMEGMATEGMATEGMHMGDGGDGLT